MKKTVCILLSLMFALAGLAALCVPANAAYKTGDVIEYGCYPQTQVEPTIKMKEVAKAADWKSYRYYCGDGTGTPVLNGKMYASGFMHYADFDYDGEKYRAVRFYKYRPDSTGKCYGADTSCQDEYGYQTNEIYCFKFKPLKWRVLDPDAGLILCENVIDSQPYQNVVWQNGTYCFADINSATFANNYYYSTIRKWLNEDFLGTAFNAAQKENIKITTLDNSCMDPSQTAFNAPSTSDKVFLLSFNEITNTNYGFGSGFASEADPARQATGTQYALCQGLDTTQKHKTSWWLRTPFYYSGVGNIVDTLGTVKSSGEAVNKTCVGVRPACCLNELKDDGAQIGGVNAVSVSDVTVNYKSSFTLQPQIIADDGAAYTVQYTSSDTNVVTVDENGTLYGAKKGTAEITFTVTDQYGNTVTDTCKVTVKYTFGQWLIVIFLFGWIWY